MMCKNTIYKLKRRIWEVFFVRLEIPFKSQRLGHYLWFFALKLLFMKNAENFKVLDSIQKIYEKSKDSELKIEILHTFEDLPFLMDFFNLQEIETVPVSYTHLDVYKRQGEIGFGERNAKEFCSCLLYTSRCV